MQQSLDLTTYYILAEKMTCGACNYRALAELPTLTCRIRVAGNVVPRRRAVTDAALSLLPRPRLRRADGASGYLEVDPSARVRAWA